MGAQPAATHEKERGHLTAELHRDDLNKARNKWQCWPGTSGHYREGEGGREEKQRGPCSSCVCVGEGGGGGGGAKWSFH
jgi:hypothetical protein